MTPDEFHEHLQKIMPTADEIVLQEIIYNRKSSGTFSFSARFGDGWLSVSGATWEKA